MPRPLRYVLIGAAVLASPFVFAFFYGIWLGLTGQLPAPDESDVAETSAPLEAEPRPAEAPPAPPPPVAAGADPASNDAPETAVPEAWLDTSTALLDLQRRGWVGVENGVPVIDPGAFATVPAEHAIALYETYREGGDEFDGVRMLVFAAFANLPPAARREFVERTDAVAPTTFFVERGWRGAYTDLVYFHDDGEMYVDALEAYARVLEDEEMIRTLRAVDALLVDDDGDGDWRIRVRHKLGHFEPRVLRAMHDAVDDALLGHRRYLRAELLELAEERSQ